ncbi:ABC-type transport auxiliary lipoprotein family protein [Salinisphaera sp. LB1]|uniref:ABC-type transport auxiliary lipoprotein family protein n=1 Tax=Salinisphaera sp. LB1 TaxID=2183911 RepID=UPI000D7D2E4F|nr:ABC-type transport auxiliary lipoprotein family protein [Salinisphaera sp. LB1]AWN16157.1 putative lipoprotein [Salinisphaera sp. LB1]
MTPCPRFFQRLAMLALVVMAASAMFGLTGCSVLSGGDHYPTRYTLDAGSSEPTSASTPSTGYTLDLRPVSAPDWLNSKRMLYRLDYANNAKLAAYTRSAWADTPARLVGDNLRDALSASGLFPAVLANASGQADLALQLELTDFSQHFSSRTASQGRISATATLLRADNGAVIAQKRFQTTAPASNANAVGGVAALAKADTQLDRDIRQWLAHTLAHCGKTCPPPGQH